MVYRAQKTSQSVVESLAVSAYRVPTDTPESDGTLEWDATTIVIVELISEGVSGIGYSYCDEVAARLIDTKLRPLVEGQPAADIAGIWRSMMKSVRNLGLPGIAAGAIAAVDNALWDLKARLLKLPLVSVLGKCRDGVPVYGSGGFTSYSLEQLQKQLAGWLDQGINRVKMKVGRSPSADEQRVRAARSAIGEHVELMVDANGAYERKQAIHKAETFADFGVSWYEEPVTSDDLRGLREVRDHSPSGMAIAAGEYGYTTPYFRAMLEAGAVDILQADATRCLGISGFLEAGALCTAFFTPLSAHTAPNLHTHCGCSVPSMIHLEYFHDHVRIEQMFFDGALVPHQGLLRPDMSRPGMGLELKTTDIQQYLSFQANGAS